MYQLNDKQLVFRRPYDFLTGDMDRPQLQNMMHFINEIKSILPNEY